MLRPTRSLAALVFAATLAPCAAYAWPVGKALHLHAEDSKLDGRLTVHVFNQAVTFRDIKVGEKTYTMLPHHGLVVTAPAGTQIYAASSGFRMHRGDLIATVSPATSNETVLVH